jgi:hypothetical protein
MMEVSRNGDTPKTLDGSRMENPYLAMDDDWGYTHFRKPPFRVYNRQAMVIWDYNQ